MLIIEDNVSYYVGMENDKEIAEIAEPIKLTGIKDMDAFHVACSIFRRVIFYNNRRQSIKVQN